MTEDHIQVLEPERTAGLFKRQEKTITQAVLNNRGRKWLRDQVVVTTVITGIGLLSGFSWEIWAGINVLSMPVTVFYSRQNYDALSEELQEVERDD